MPSQGQAKARRAERYTNPRGYAMAVLLIAMAVMSIMITVLMPAWKHAAQREREEELVFRGRQYVHAIGLFQRKFANAMPPSVDVLVEQRFLRKKFKDPITNDDFVAVTLGSLGAAAAVAPGRGSQGPARGGQPTTAATVATGLQPPAGRGVGSPGSEFLGGVMGVTSKSKDPSIRVYNGRGHYNEWAFIYTAQSQQPTGAVPGSAVPGQPSPPGPRGRRGSPGQQRPSGPAGQRGR